MLDSVLVNSVDNTAGLVRYDASKLTGAGTGNFRIATVRFQALKVAAPSTPLVFTPSTDVFSGLASVLDKTEGATITVREWTYLPVVMR